MEAIVDNYQRWRRLPFPPGSSSDRVDELHADLVLADGWVADTVIPFVERGLHRPAKIDVIAELRDLERRAAELARVVGDDDIRLVGDYAAYAALLVLVYQDFLARARQ